MTLLAPRRPTGMHNLFRLGSLASLEGHFYKPRIDRELLNTLRRGADRHHRLPERGDPDLPAAGPVRRGDRQRRGVPGHLRPGQLLRRADGPRPVHREPGPGGPAAARQGPGAPAGRHQRPALRDAGDAAAHEVLLCVQSGSTMADPNRFKFDGDGYYLKSPAEMRAHLGRAARGLRQHAGHRRALRRLLRRGRGDVHAALPLPAGGERAVLVRQGGRDRPAAPVPERDPGLRPRAGRVRDPRSSPRWASPATSWSSPTSSTGPRRTASGSDRVAGPAPGSMAAYAMRITDLDPLEHGLIFERFLNPDRVSMPDFDIDFDERRRGEVIRYVTEKYGDDRVARSSRTARSRPSRPSRTPPGCSATRSRWARSSPRRCRRR